MTKFPTFTHVVWRTLGTQIMRVANCTTNLEAETYVHVQTVCMGKPGKFEIQKYAPNEKVAYRA